MAFAKRTWRLYIQLNVIDQNATATFERFAQINKHGLVAQHNILPHITLSEIHIDLAKLFPTTYTKEFIKAHPMRVRQAFAKTNQFKIFNEALSNHINAMVSSLLNGVKLYDPFRLGYHQHDQNYSLLGQTGSHPFLAKRFNIEDSKNGDSYITQFRIAIYKFINNYFNLNNGRYDKVDEKYQYFRHNGQVIYAVPLHSWGRGKWLPHMSIAKININNYDASNTSSNGAIITNLLEICKKIHNRTAWDHITIGIGTQTSFTLG